MAASVTADNTANDISPVSTQSHLLTFLLLHLSVCRSWLRCRHNTSFLP